MTHHLYGELKELKYIHIYYTIQLHQKYIHYLFK